MRIPALFPHFFAMMGIMLSSSLQASGSLGRPAKQAGKPAKMVIVACMRKLLTIMNAMAKNNAQWNPKIA